jgi:SHAQKYF class myb-like DNA-binding protein
MKKLFVIKNIDTIKEDNSQKLLNNNDKSDKENLSLELDLRPSQSDSTNLTQSPKKENQNNSRKYSLFVLSTENSTSTNLSNNSDLDSRANEQNTFLGKKIKYHFNVTKNSPQKIKQNNLTTTKVEKKLNQEKIGKNESLNIEESEVKEEIKNKKEGRWSLEERNKFIEALIENGKNWRSIQKYIGSRTCAQTRSHAQKFLLKLRTIENSEFNFKKDSIKNLNDIVEEIKNKEGIKNINDNINKKNIIETLISLSEGNSFETRTNENSTSNNNKTKIIKFENLNSNLKTQITNNNNKKENNNNKNDEPKNSEDKANKEQENKKLKIIEEKKPKIEIIYNNNSKENNFYGCFSEPLNQKLIFDDGIAFYADNNSIYDINNISYYIKEYNFVRNIEKSKLINRNFFS